MYQTSDVNVLRQRMVKLPEIISRFLKTPRKNKRLTTRKRKTRVLADTGS